MTTNGFKVDNEDMAIILRRCDHDNDGKLSYDEFADILDLPEEERIQKKLPDSLIKLHSVRFKEFEKT